MEIAVKSWVFNPELKGLIVSVTGVDDEGDSISVTGCVIDISGDIIEVRNYSGTELKEFRFSLQDFSSDGLVLKVFNQPTDIVPNHHEQTSALTGEI